MNSFENIRNALKALKALYSIVSYNDSNKWVEKNLIPSYPKVGFCISISEKKKSNLDTIMGFASSIISWLWPAFMHEPIAMAMDVCVISDRSQVIRALSYDSRICVVTNHALGVTRRHAMTRQQTRSFDVVCRDGRRFIFPTQK